MPVNVLFSAHPERWNKYAPPIREALAEVGINADLHQELPPDQVDYIVYAPDSDIQDFTPYTRAKAVLNIWAGVENITGNQSLNIPLARMVDPGMTQGMMEWVCGHVMRHHLGMDLQILGQNGTWEKHVPPLAPERRVTILGLGELGATVAKSLAGLGFDVAGWSRRPKDIAGITTFSGDDGLHAALSRAEILVLLLPLTPETEDLLNAERLALLPEGAFLINPGRGPLIDDAALLAALERGQIGHATLDVFRIEPLPADHPYWAHPRVTVTPHIASATRASTSARVLAENIRRGEAGEPFLHLVDRQAGY